MIIRRNLLRGLAAGTAAASFSTNPVLAAAVRTAHSSMESLPACIIACQEKETLDESTISIDYWTFMINNVHGSQLSKGCCKVAIWDGDLSPGRMAQDVAHLYHSISKYYEFDPLSHPHHATLHVHGVTDLQERIRSVLAVKSTRTSMARVALINEDSACFYLFTDWPAILPSLRAHYDHIVAVSISDMESESSEFDDPEFEVFRKWRREKIAGLCDAVVEIDFPYAAAAAAAAAATATAAAEDEDDYGYEQITERTCEIANALLRKTPVEIRSLPACGAIPFRDWMALVA